jgi:uncharacterized protein YdhG (YjbR/CyaY superfamily)
MAKKRPATIKEYIEAAPPEARSHLRQLYRILKGTMQIPYDQPLPEDLVRKIAAYCITDVRENDA